MIQETVTIQTLTGLHLRPASMLCNTALEFKCHVHFRFQGSVYNAKSVLSVLGACVKRYDTIELICDGVDEELAMKTLLKLIQSGLGE